MRHAALIALIVLGTAADVFGQARAVAGGQPGTSLGWREPRIVALFTYGGSITEATGSLRRTLRDAGYSFDSGSNLAVGFGVHYRFYGRWSAGIVGGRSTRHVDGDPIGLPSGAVVEADYDVSSLGVVVSGSFVVKRLQRGEITVFAGAGPARHAVRTRDSLDSTARDRFETNGYITQVSVQAVGGPRRIKLAAEGGLQYRKVGRGGTGPLTARPGFPAVPRVETSFDDVTIRIGLGVGF